MHAYSLAIPIQLSPTKKFKNLTTTRHTANQSIAMATIKKKSARINTPSLRRGRGRMSFSIDFWLRGLRLWRIGPTEAARTECWRAARRRRNWDASQSRTFRRPPAGKRRGKRRRKRRTLRNCLACCISSLLSWWRRWWRRVRDPRERFWTSVDVGKRRSRSFPSCTWSLGNWVLNLRRVWGVRQGK